VKRKDLIVAIASIELSEQEMHALHELAQQTGKTQENLLHEAVTQLLTQRYPQDRAWFKRT
jgi:predicted transcriptional regulator